MKSFVFLIFAALLLFSGCSTMINTTTQEVELKSNPANAKIIIDGKKFGTTPQIVNLERGAHHIVKFELQGYETYEVQITNRLSHWVWLNTFNGFIPGFTIDWLNGSMYNLYPLQFEAVLTVAPKPEPPPVKK